MTRLDLTNKKFGHLIAIRPIGKHHTQIVWECKCDCGNLTKCTASRLKRGKKKSCGCYKIGEKHYKWSGHKGICGRYWRAILDGANQRGFPVKINPKEAWKLFKKQHQKCALSGADLTLERNDDGQKITEQTASLDRIDSNKGYIRGNIRWVHKNINRMRMDMNDTEFIEWCKKIVNHTII